jgi:hypothetical protein
MKSSQKQKLLTFLAKLTGNSVANLKFMVDTEAASFPYVMKIQHFREMYGMTGPKGDRVLKPHPRQRETEMRLKKAIGKKGHLSTFSLAHTEIVVALFKGQLYLVDGNHRAKLWHDFPEAWHPSHVTLIVKQFDDSEEDEFIELYYAYDSKASLETGRQKLYGYMAAAGYAEKLKTSFMRNGRFKTAMKHLNVPFDGREAEVMADWEKEIVAFDDDLSRDEKSYNCGIVAGLLLLYRKEPRELVAEFFEKIQTIGLIRATALKFRRQLSDADQIISDFDEELTKVTGRNNDGIIDNKRTLTLDTFAQFKALTKAAAVMQEPKRRLKKTENGVK